MSKLIRANSKVKVIATPTFCRNSLPAANWIAEQEKQGEEVELLEPAVIGTLDVVDVRLPDGTVSAIYGFNIER